jgi:hypothetical protein
MPVVVDDDLPVEVIQLGLLPPILFGGHRRMELGTWNMDQG